MPFGSGDYEIHIKGRLSDSLLATFEGLTPTVEPAQMVLYGPVRDQASLHGLLERLQLLGLDLIEIRRLPVSADEAPGESEHQPPEANGVGGALNEIERLAHPPGCRTAHAGEEHR